MGNGWRWLAALFLCGLFSLQVYRAATQSITVDEARVYMDFLRPEPAALLNHYDAAHHVLQTYLSWILVQWWGNSELVLRLPALLACIAYFGFAYRFSTRLFGYTAMFFGSVLLLTTNPLLLDHFSVARGYGVALALFAWALLAAFDGQLFAAGLLSGLSVAANLTFATPAVALATATALTRHKPGKVIREFAGPGAIVCALIVLLPVLHARPDQFYYGAPTLQRAFLSLVEVSVDRRYWGATPIRFGIAAGLAGLGAAGVGLIFGGRKARLVSLALVAGLLATVGLNRLFGTPYPFFRTGIWLLFLITAGALAGGRVLADMRPRMGAAGAAVALITSCVYLTQYDPRFTFEWREIAAVKRYLRIVEGREAGRNRVYRISGNPEYKFPADYYRVRFQLANMEAMRFNDPQPEADYYVFNGGDRHEAARRWQVTPIADDPVCLCLLAER